MSDKNHIDGDIALSMDELNFLKGKKGYNY